MREIVCHDRDFLIGDIAVYVDENDVQFINGIAAVNATANVGKRKTPQTYSGIIDENYNEVFDVDYKKFGEACQNLMFIGYNSHITRCGENDFIVTVRQGDEYHTHYAIKHIRLDGLKASFVNQDIGSYSKSNNENILIIGGEIKCNNSKMLYDVKKGQYVTEAFDEISVIEGSDDRFAVKKRITSLTEDSPKGEDLYLVDDLYYQIDSTGAIVSKIFSKRKLDYLDYDSKDVKEYLNYCKQELIAGSKVLQEKVRALRN